MLAMGALLNFPDNDERMANIIGVQAKEFDCEDGENSLKLTTSSQSSQSVKVSSTNMY